VLTFKIEERDIQKAVKKIVQQSQELFEYITHQTKLELEKYAEDLRDFIKEQKGNWEELSEQYKAYKQRKGLDPRILIATGKYLNSIKVVQEGTRFKIVPEGYEELAQYLEFGTSRMPARPHWTYIDIQIRYTLINTLRLLASKKALQIKEKQYAQ